MVHRKGRLCSMSSATAGEMPDLSMTTVTLDTYSHSIPAMQEEAAALVAGLVFAGE